MFSYNAAIGPESQTDGSTENNAAVCDCRLVSIIILPAKVREYVFTGVGLCLYVCLSVCMCVCLSVTMITKKIVDGFVPNFMGRFLGGKGRQVRVSLR